MKKKCLFIIITLIVLSGLILTIFPIFSMANDWQQAKFKDLESGIKLGRKISNRAILRLHRLKVRIQNSKLSDEKKNKALSQIDNETKWWQAKKEAISNAKSTSDLQKIGKDLKTRIQQYKKNMEKLKKERQKNKNQTPKTNESFI